MSHAASTMWPLYQLTFDPEISSSVLGLLKSQGAICQQLHHNNHVPASQAPGARVARRRGLLVLLDAERADRHGRQVLHRRPVQALAVLVKVAAVARAVCVQHKRMCEYVQSTRASKWVAPSSTAWNLPLTQAHAYTERAAVPCGCRNYKPSFTCAWLHAWPLNTIAALSAGTPEHQNLHLRMLCSDDRT